MRMNTRRSTAQLRTHEGGKAKKINSEQELRRSLMSCMLFEKTFYENDIDINDRFKELVPKVSPEKVASMAIEARTKMKLRHAPLYITKEMARNKSHRYMVKDTLADVIQRADELAEFLAMYWEDGKQPLANSVKKGLAKAFTKFNEYHLAKYNRPNTIKLRDVLFLCHAKPLNKEQEELWKRLVNDELKTPDTWEVSMSATKGENKKEVWEGLLDRGVMGDLAILKNLRNFYENDVDENKVFKALENVRGTRVFPSRYLSAARYAPQWEEQIEKALFKLIEQYEKLKGKTTLLVDVSGSMHWEVSDRSEVTRLDAASSLAILIRELCEKVDIFTFSDDLIAVPPRRGFALRDAINDSQYHSGTYLKKAMDEMKTKVKQTDRLIIITDEQSHDGIGESFAKENNYVINVAPYRNGIGYYDFIHIDGFSDAIIEYIKVYENEFN